MANPLFVFRGRIYYDINAQNKLLRSYLSCWSSKIKNYDNGRGRICHRNKFKRNSKHIRTKISADGRDLLFKVPKNWRSYQRQYMVITKEPFDTVDEQTRYNLAELYEAKVLHLLPFLNMSNVITTRSRKLIQLCLLMWIILVKRK